MTIKINFKSLIAAALLSGMSSFAAQSGDDDNRLAPEASAAEYLLPYYRDMPELKEAFIDTAPANRKDGIDVGELGIDGGNKAMILKLAQEIAGNKHGHFDSLLIAHKGKLMFESYYSRGRVNLPHYQASANKSYIGLAIGRAIQLGYLTMADLDKPLISFFKGLDSTKFAKGAEKITLHKALTMSSGVRINGDKIKEIRENPALLKNHGQLQAYLENSTSITAESQNFSYGFDPSLVMLVLDAVVPGGSADDFIKNELLRKMGIKISLPDEDWRYSMTSRAMLKWGTMVINKGKWQGEQLIPAAFIARATSKIADPGEEYADDVVGVDVSGTAYGYFWWQADLTTGGKSYFSKAARGGGGQFIIVIEELELIVVVTASRRNFETSSFTATRILPAFI